MNLIQQLNTQLSTLVDSASRSLVQVQNGHEGRGAGTIWHPSGLILTNAHVVGRGRRDRLSVTLADGRRLPAQLLAEDRRRDLAALAIDIDDAATIKLGNDRDLRPGDWVVAIGHPWGIKGAVTAGNIIAAGALPEMRWSGGELLQLSLQLRPGHSGGPLLDSLGRLVGINVMIAGPSVGLAIPLHTVKQFLQERLGSSRKRNRSRETLVYV